MPFPLIHSTIRLALTFAFLCKVDSLVVTNPCCHMYEHRGAMFGPELPVKSDYFNYNDREMSGPVEGVLKQSITTNNPTFCHPKMVSKLNDDFSGTIALIPRGGCSFAEKVYFAELAGAKAAIIFQSHDARGNHDSFMPSTTNDDVIVMAEDSHYGNIIKIPSAFVSFNSWREIQTLFSVKSIEEQLEEEILGLGRNLHQGLWSSMKSAFFPPQFSDETVDYIPIATDEEESAGARLLQNSQLVYVVLNETGSLSNTGSDSLPMMWESMVFLVKVFLIIWSVMGFAYVTNYIKMRYRQYKRSNIIRSLPCQKYKKLRKHNFKTKHKNGKKFQQVGTQSDDEKQSEVQDSSNLASETERLLEEGNLSSFDQNAELSPQQIEQHLKTTSFSAELKMRSPKKKRKPLISQSFTAGSIEHDLSGLSDSSKSSNRGSKSKDSLSDVEGDDRESVGAQSKAHSIIDCENCVICLSEFEAEDMATVLPCKHIYHKECIEPWLTNKSSLCPICKQSIFKNGESRPISELNREDGPTGPDVDLSEESQTEGEQRRGSIALSIGMFLVIVLSFTFMMVDDNS